MSPPRQLKLLSPGKSPAKRRRLASSSPSAKDRWSTNKRPFPFLDFPVEIQTMALTELLTEMPPQLVVRSASKPHPPPVLRVSKGICEQALQVLRNIYFYQKSISKLRPPLRLSKEKKEKGKKKKKGVTGEGDFDAPRPAPPPPPSPSITKKGRGNGNSIFL